MSVDLSTLAEQLRSGISGPVQLDLPLAQFTTYRIGGPADLVLFPADTKELAMAVAQLQQAGVPWEVLGGGSNVLVSDRGVRGAVVMTVQLTQLEVEQTRIRASAGVDSHQVAEAARDAGLSGAEFLTWLPGSIGGACLMNARAYGGEISEVLTGAIVVTPRGEIRQRQLGPEQFSYKRSPFSQSDEIIAEVTLSLRQGQPERIQQQMDLIEQQRRANREMDHPSCGCVFKNDHRIGVSSGKLIDDCGLKGFRIGDAQVSPHHANFVINLGRATAEQVWQVAQHVRRTVAEQTGHRLELEMRRMGQWEGED